MHGMKAILFILVAMHGLAHLAGVANVFNVWPVSQSIAGTNAMLWLVTAVLFMVTASLLFFKKHAWLFFCVLAILLSQYLIFANWHTAKFGTIVNVIILFAVILGYNTMHFSNKYKSEVKDYLLQTMFVPDTLLTEADIQALPLPVKKYLHYAGVLNKPKIRNFEVEFKGQIRKDSKSAWMPFTSQQYNFVDASTRLFFMNATMKHLPVKGFHCFKNGAAFMDIRLLSMFRVQYQAGKEMGIAETVTFFNDMCLMAPATLVDKRIHWFEVDNNKVRASFTHNNITIFATLYFNHKGQLINFISDDRYTFGDDNTMHKIPWSTPVKYYRKINGYTLPGYADTIYSYPAGDLCYGNFKVTNIEYNCKSFADETKQRMAPGAPNAKEPNI